MTGHRSGAVCALGVAVTLLVSGCSSAPQASAPPSPLPRSSAESTTSAASTTAGGAAATFSTPTSPCFVPPDTVAGIARLGPLTPTPVGISNPDKPGQWSGACLYGGSGGQSASILTALRPTVPGQTVQQYLTEDIAGQASFTAPQNIPGLGDLAELSSLGCGNGNCGYAVATVQVHGNTVAEVEVTLTRPAPGQDPVISLARAALTALAP